MRDYRFTVSLTKVEIVNLIGALCFHNETNAHIYDGAEKLIERLKRRLVMVQSEEAQRNSYTDYTVGI